MMPPYFTIPVAFCQSFYGVCLLDFTWCKYDRAIRMNQSESKKGEISRWKNWFVFLYYTHYDYDSESGGLRQQRNYERTEGQAVRRCFTDASTSIEKVIDGLDEMFMEHNSGITFTYNPTGSGSGIKDVQGGTCDICGLCRLDCWCLQRRVSSMPPLWMRNSLKECSDRALSLQWFMIQQQSRQQQPPPNMAVSIRAVSSSILANQGPHGHRSGCIAQTDEGVDLQAQVDDLVRLMEAYRSGAVAENHQNWL